MASRKPATAKPVFAARVADPGTHEWFDGDSTHRVVVGADRNFQPTSEAHQIQADQLGLPRWRAPRDTKGA